MRFIYYHRFLSLSIVFKIIFIFSYAVHATDYVSRTASPCVYIYARPCSQRPKGLPRTRFGKLRARTPRNPHPTISTSPANILTY